MLVGALTALLFQSISLSHAWEAVKLDVILYLLGVFMIAEALEQSGYLENITYQCFNHTNRGWALLWLMSLSMGLLSALFMNDTVAILGTPVILQLTRKHPEMRPPLLLTLAYSVTIGSVTSPIGNPQNLLIAIESGMTSPILSFFKTLFLPTLINLMIMTAMMATIYRTCLMAEIAHVRPQPLSDKRTAKLAQVAVVIMLILILVRIGLRFFYSSYHLSFSVISLVSALPIFLGSSKRWRLLKQLDWGTLIFFIGLFILMRSVWESGYFQGWIEGRGTVTHSISSIFVVSALISQFISNVPLVAFYLPLLKHVGAELAHYLALAVGSTLAGNIFIFGAASNIIIIQNAEKRGEEAFHYGIFSLIGCTITLVNFLIYYLFLQ